MTMKFSCPHCQKTLKVKDELAGKKAKCPGCQKVIVIPKPKAVAAPPVALPADVEAFAAAALADQPKPEAAAEEQAPATVEFQCDYCDEKVQVSAELAGKQAPCPQLQAHRQGAGAGQEGADRLAQGRQPPSLGRQP